jgi:hypothetical protein
MDTQTLNFLRGLTLDDARQAFRNALNEAGQPNAFFGPNIHNTDSYHAFKSACEMIVEVIREQNAAREPMSLGMTPKEHLAYNKRQPKSVFGINVYKFLTAENAYKRGTLI